MEAPRHWRHLQRHPLGAQYCDLKGEQFRRMVEMVKTYGIFNQRKIVLYEGKIIAGWQLYRACLSLGVKPVFVDLARMKPKLMPLEDWLEGDNEIRRHETAEQLAKHVADRAKRVMAAATAGKTTREIAKEEEISQTQVRRDLEKAKEDEEGENGEGKTTRGRDGKDHAAGKYVHLLCERCGRVGKVQGCEDCERIRDTARKRDSRKKVSWKWGDWNKAFGVVTRCLDTFAKHHAIVGDKRIDALRDRLATVLVDLKLLKEAVDKENAPL